MADRASQIARFIITTRRRGDPSLVSFERLKDFNPTATDAEIHEAILLAAETDDTEAANDVA